MNRVLRAWIRRRGGSILTEPDDSPRPAAHEPLASLRGRNFRLFAIGRLCAGAAQTLQQVAIAWQVYSLTHSALQLGLLGLMRFVPALGMSLIGGALADSFDRRRIVVISQLAPLVATAILFVTTSSGAINLPLIYGLVLVIAIASSFENPARQALLPLLVPRDLFPNAVTLSSAVQQFAFVGGPAFGGILIATSGVASAYAITVLLIAITIISLLLLSPRREAIEKRAMSLRAIKEGISFVRHRQVLFGVMTLDMFAVILGGATAMLPIYAQQILKVGAGGYGVLTSAQPVGALIMGVALVALPPIKQTGRALLMTVAAFGLTTMLFGIARSFPLSLLAYGLTGAADQVSVVMRQTTIQLATPDALRGRVSAISSLFVGASNQVGAVESGLVAAITSATFSVVSGGAGCIAVVCAVAAGMPELRRYRITPLRERIAAAKSGEAP